MQKTDDFNDTSIEHGNCRMCLSSAEDFVSLQHNFMISSTEKLNYMEAYNYCTHLSATACDNLPQIICISCSSDLEIVFNIIKKAKQTDHILREIFKKPVEAEETTNDKQITENQEDVRNCEEFPNDHLKFEQLVEFVEVNSDDEPNISDDIDNLEYIDETSKDQELQEILMEPQKEEEENITHPYACNLCEATFSSDKALTTHLGTHKEEKKRRRTLWRNVWEQPEDTKPESGSRQTPAKTKQESFICEMCGKMCSSKQLLKIHTFVHTKEKNFPCQICSKSFITISRAREHMKSHTDVRPHECEICKRRFFSKHTLVCHMRRHTGERPYKCDICKKTFSQSSILKTHRALHTGKTVECPHCYKKFSRRSHLILHERSHTGERPYKCHLCTNAYKQKSHLDRHIDTHYGVTHTCGVCGKVYTKKSTLTTHMFVHAENKPYVCPICQMEFTSTDKYRRHKKTHDPDVEVAEVPFDIEEVYVDSVQEVEEVK